ncbi:MAG: hypothetical protein O3C60_20485, partial [Planctomycetota bacterium]|nr:hypothetical protein [Planctomycetota bacterium]
MLSFVMSLVVISVTVSGAPEPAPLKGVNASSTEQGVLGNSQPGGEQAASLAWSGDYGKALAMARASGKPLIVLIEKSDDPSHSVDVAKTFSAGDQEGVTAKFELCRVDASTQYGQELAKSFGVYQFPFTAVSTRDGTRIAYRRQGPITSDQLRSALATVQNHTVLRPSLDAENVLTPWDGSASVRRTNGASVPGNCP